MDPIFGPILFCLLVAWYLTSRFGSDLRTLGQWAAATLADGVATVAGKVGATRVQAAARAAARRLRARPAPGTPRTAAGQTFRAQLRAAGRRIRDGLTTAVDGAGLTAGAGAAGMGVGRLVTWLRLVWVDAKAAARSARQRRAEYGYPPRAHWYSRPEWLSWPTGDDPQAPVHAEATRLDRDDTEPAALNAPAAALPADGDQSVDTDVIDGELVAVDESPLVTPVAAITDGRNTAMDTTVAESGLDAYLQHSQHMASECEAAMHSAEATVAALTNQDWSGAPVEAYQSAMEALSSASSYFNQAAAAFQSALAVREAYAANDHAGTKESVNS
jgi:hypothetical protein